MHSSLVVANWKMNLPPEGLETYMNRLNRATTRAALAVAPPHPFLGDVARLARRGRDAIGVAGQNCHENVSGAFTGEVSAEMLRSIRASMVILGHSERRRLFGESEDLVGRKLAAAQRAGLAIILCIGEDEAEREAGMTVEIVERQLTRALTAAENRNETLVVAYEPVWAVGTGKNATPEIIAEMHGAIRKILAATVGPRPILYGGSVTPENAAALAAADGVDGFLVGGASLSSERFLKIAAAF